MAALAQPARPRLVATFPDESRGIGHVRFSPDGRTLVIATGESLILWEVATRQVRATLKSPVVLDIAFAPDGKGLATDLGLWDLTTGESKALPLRTQGVLCLAFSPDGKTLASGSAFPDGTVKLVDLATGREAATLEARESVFALAFSPDGKTLAAAGGKGTSPPFGKVWLWDVASKRLRLTLDYGYPPGYLAFSPDGQTLAVRVLAGLVQFRDPASGRLRASWTSDTFLDAGFTFSPDGRVLVAGGGFRDMPGFVKGSGEVKFWDVPSKKEILTFQAHEDGVGWIALSPDGTLLAVSIGKRGLPMNLWDVSAITGRKPPDRPPAAPVRARPAPADQGQAPAGNLTAEELQKLWSDLASADAARAYKAIWALVGAPKQAVPFVGTHLKPVPPIDPKQIERLLADLESDQFAVRQQAGLELEKAEEQAEPALRQVLRGKPRPETRTRAEQLLEKLAGPVTAPEKLQALRSLEVLEHIGSPEAWQVLEALAKGAPHARVTQEAILSLERLSKRAAYTP